jgi:YHS domain-containing protein
LEKSGFKTTNQQKERMFMKNKALVLFIVAVMGLAFASSAVMAQNKPAEKKESGCAMKADQDSCKAGEKKCDKAEACCKEAMVCPVSGKPGNKEIFSEYKGQKVFFCCQKAKEAFDKDPAKYEAKIHKCTGDCKKAAGEDSCKAGKKKCDKAEACCKEAMVCPVSGKPGNKEIFSEYKGQKVFFCCQKAKEAFDKDPAKYEAKIHKCTGDCKKEAAKSEKKVEKPAKK